MPDSGSARGEAGLGARVFLAAVLGLGCVWFALGMHRGILVSADCLPWMWPWKGVSDVVAPQAPTLTDPLLQFYPWLNFAREELMAGRLPLWNPYQDGGVPLLGNSQSAIASPLVWPVLLLGFEAGWNLSLLFRIGLAAVGTLLWLRGREQSWVASLSGAVMVGLSGPVVAWLEHPHTLTFAPVPLLLAAVDRCKRSGSAASVGAVVLTTVFVIAGGHPETAMMAALFAAIVALSPADRGGVRTCLAAGVGGLLTAPLWLPVLEYLRLSTTIAGEARGAVVLSWDGLIRFIVPKAAVGHPIENSVTISVLGLVLAIVGGFVLLRSRRWGWVLGAGGLLLLIFDTPVAMWIGQLTTVYWSRSVLFLTLIAAYAAAVGLDSLLKMLRIRSLPAAARAVAVVAPLLIATELVLAARGVHAIVAPEELSPSSPLLEQLRRDDGLHRILFLNDTLPPNFATVLRIEDLRGYDSIWPRGWRERRQRDVGVFKRDMISLDRVRPNGLDEWNVKYIVGGPMVEVAEQARRDIFRDRLRLLYQGPDGMVFQNLGCKPRARFLGPGSVAVRTRDPGRWRLEVEAEGDGAVVIANPFFPGWQVKVDGEAVAVEAAPGDPIEVAVSPGRHEIELVYRPASLRLGLIFAFCGGAAFLAWVLVRGRSRRR